MPAYLKSFISSTHAFTKKFGGKQRHLWCPKDMRKDVRTIRHLLKTASNYCLLHPKAGRQKAPPVTGDARGGGKAAGAYVTPHGRKWWKYTANMKKEHINLLECQVLEQYLQDNAAYHEGQILPYYGDNSVTISCVRKGRSNSRELNAMVQRILLMCYQYDLYLELTLIPSKVNVLADAASRQQWHVFDAHWPTFDLFAEYRRHQKWGASKSSDKLQVLHPRARQAVHDTKKDAFEPSTISNAKSAWVLWEAYMQDNNRDAYLDLNDPHFDVYIAGYEACLTQGLYGKLRSSDSILTYKSQILWCLNQHNQSRLKQDVERGMQKQLRFNKRPVDPWRLEYFASLYERHAHSKKLHQLQTLLALSFLGFGIQRSRSAVTKIASVFETDKKLCVSDVRLDRDLYAVWWGVKSSKGDPFAKRMGRDRKDWVPTAGCKAAQHPIWNVLLLCRFLSL